MREKIKDYDRLLHIQESIDNVFEFMEGKTIDELEKDKLLFFGVVNLPKTINVDNYDT